MYTKFDKLVAILSVLLLVSFFILDTFLNENKNYILYRTYLVKIVPILVFIVFFRYYQRFKNKQL